MVVLSRFCPFQFVVAVDGTHVCPGSTFNAAFSSTGRVVGFVIQSGVLPIEIGVVDHFRVNELGLRALRCFVCVERKVFVVVFVRVGRSIFVDLYGF